jgi:hypothetical protein
MDLLYCEETANFHNSEILSEKRKQTVSLCFIFVLLYHNLYLHEALVSILFSNCQLKAKSENGDGRQYNKERLEDTRGIFRSRRSMTDRQYYGQKKMD